MDYISDHYGCWFEETVTGRVTWIQKGVITATSSGQYLPTTREILIDRMDTCQGHRYELWQACDLTPERTWTSDTYNLLVDHEVSITLFVDPEIASVYVLVPSSMGSTIKISPRSYLETDEWRSRLCINVRDGRPITPSIVEGFFRSLAANYTDKNITDIAKVGLASFPDNLFETPTSPINSEYNEVLFLTAC